MKTATSKFVTTFDVCVVVGACTCGALSGILGLQNIKQMNAKLKEVQFLFHYYFFCIRSYEDLMDYMEYLVYTHLRSTACWRSTRMKQKTGVAAIIY